MLFTITSTQSPATDLGYLLHKNPARVHERAQSYGKATVFYPEASAERCTAALFVEVDPVGLVRDRKGFAATGLLDQYVNDRPYAASSLLSAAISEMYGSALNGRCPDRPELVATAMPLELEIPVLPCRGGDALLHSLFEPLGYTVTSRRLPLDPHFPEWGDSAYRSVRLAGRVTVQEALSHVYVLVPVLDNSKHYWVGEDEVEKLLKRGEPWLSTHPARELIVRRYLKHKRSLADMALERLLEVEEGASERDEPGEVEAVRGDEGERSLERKISLNDRRMAAVAAAVEGLGAASLVDLGCGEGKLIKAVLPSRNLQRILGIDVSHRALEIARDRLGVERLPRTQQDKLTLAQGSLIYRDSRFQGFDVATVIEVIEHLDEARLDAFTRVLFQAARPRSIVMTTPNREYNALFATLPAGRFRHSDHRFEWTRAEFEAWAATQAERFGYGVRFEPIGDVDPQLGPPTQMAVFTSIA